MTTQIAQQDALSRETPVNIDVAVQAVEDVMMEIVNSRVDVLRDASHHILGAGGKRIRPRLLMLCYLALGGTDVKFAAPPAAAVELMHTASVVHDDINDHGVLRRGRPSVNAKWGRTFALLTGDFLFTSVYQLMSPYSELNKILADAATALVEGETLQAAAVKNNEFTREAYARIIALKTAALFRAAGEMGARLADANEKFVEAMSSAAYNIGLAFQIVDDILDIVGDEEQLGKTSGIDIAQGRGFVSATESASSLEVQNGASADDVIDNVKRKLLEGNRLEEARAQAKGLIDMAVRQIGILPESAAKDELIALAQMVINRDH
ncbi:polyprenyl synthetase family protein [Phototrophicus methaneseepsis]|uniref:Polyprenyl synthetase family protein n=1 Tax=Phototrophicus methaneseepsis TaxID=2710758 RepID=A0A7S8IC31_9CHLR|nr:polyprenyl synthetase family protein [Phototrophicus methaneseepsis]QPC81105.1 polyprenyl synthetase family protein [Phototrophicus methaneseepsis]